MSDTRLRKKAKKKIDGTDRDTPSNVSKRASEMPLATSLAFNCTSDMAMTPKLEIIPLSVPSSPIIGPSVPNTANRLIFFSMSAVSMSPIRSIDSRASLRPLGNSVIPVTSTRLKKESSSLTTLNIPLKSRCSSIASQWAITSGGIAVTIRSSMNMRLTVAMK